MTQTKNTPKLKYNCTLETFLKRIEDLKKVIPLKQEYDQIRNCPLEVRLEIIDRIAVIFPSSVEYNKKYILILLRGADDERLKDIYNEIEPIGAMLQEFDNDTELHELRFQITKNNLLDIVHAIQTGYFKDGTKFIYKSLTSTDTGTSNYDLIETCKRLTFAGKSRLVYFYSCCKVNPNIGYFNKRMGTKINDFIAHTFPRNNDHDYSEIEKILRKFMFENGLNNLGLLAEEKIINDSKKEKQAITIYTNNMEQIIVTLTKGDYQRILDYMNKENVPFLDRVYNELIIQYAKIKYYTNGNEELIDLILFQETSRRLSLLERISILEFLIDNHIPVAVETYNNFLESFIFKKECHICNNPEQEQGMTGTLERKRTPPKAPNN